MLIGFHTIFLRNVIIWNANGSSCKSIASVKIFNNGNLVDESLLIKKVKA